MKKILLALALCLVMVALTASPALAATQRVNLVADGTTTILGSTTFITNQGDAALVVYITLKGAAPNMPYTVELEAVPVLAGELFEGGIGYLTTNAKGNWGGQNQQYEFVKILKAGRYNVSLTLTSAAGDIIETFQPVTVRITKN
jgi:VCBS repeat-containing protein